MLAWLRGGISAEICQDAVTTNLRKRSRPLEDDDPEEPRNKRLNTLECVRLPTLPKGIADTYFRYLDQENTAPSITTSSKKHETNSQKCSLPVLSRSQQNNGTLLRDPALFDKKNTPFHPVSSNGRPVRTKSRPQVSYASFLPSSDDSSDDVTNGGGRNVSRKRRSYRRKNVPGGAESDEDVFIPNDVESDHEDETGSEAALEESSLATNSEDEFSDLDEPARKPRRQAKTSAPTSNSKSKSSSFGIAGRKASQRMLNLLKRPSGAKGLDLSLPPLHEIDDIFADLTNKALELGLNKALQHLHAKRLRVATMCSGTESPILALRMIRSFLQTTGQDQLNIEHLFSAEIVPYKQAYIERNFNPPIIFRDITELTEAVKHENPVATTAYGAKVSVPTNIDIVIAGTSCVDFSKLNNHQKGLQDGGESDKTWHAVLNYCAAFRPAVVVLENVKNADWDRMLQSYEDIEYHVAGAYVDTKDFYIPQTRQRGYMACFDKKRFQDVKIADRWQKTVSSLRRYASSPVSSFLLPSDQVMIRDQSRGDDTKRDYDWSRCEITQMQYRQTQRLGNARPFTNWQESGAMSIPDHGSKSWYSAQVERVLDTIDAATLRKALPKNGSYDCRYKTRIWNLSQNIYRDEDNQSFGMIGCITPSGQYFISDAGRAMTPEEILKLQGLPLNQISFTTETPVEIQDLAGNAMSSSVIGSAIISALIVGCQGVGEADSRVASENQQAQKPELVSGPMTTQNYTPMNEDLSVSFIMDAGRRSMRRCYCEHATDIAKKPIQQCVECGHTTCTSCGGNPSHDYRQEGRFIHRLSPGQFEADLRARLPLRIKLHGVEGFLSQLRDVSKCSAYAELVNAASNSEFCISSFRRTNCITITYQSSCGRMELVLDDHKILWRFFADCPKTVPSNAWLRRILRYPVAVCDAKATIFEGKWQVRLPKTATTQLVIEGKGKKMPTWWSRNGMPDFTNHWQWEMLQIATKNEQDNGKISRIVGQYKYLPKCGAACDSLYKRIGQETAEDMFLFLDPDRTGAPEEDCFVFSTNKAMLEYDEVRLIEGSLEPAWKPWDQGPFSKLKSEQISKRDGNSRLNLVQLQKPNVTLTTDCEWRTIDEMSLRPIQTNINLSVSQDFGSSSSDCGKAVILTSCRIPEASDCDPENRLIETTDVELGDDKFFAQHGWLFEALRRQLSTEWQLLPIQCPRTCSSCAPARPALRWKLTTDADIVAYEDPSTAAAYERSMKSRPAPLIVRVNGTHIHFGINLISLAHRASARLPSTVEDVRLDWRLSTQATTSQFTFRPFRLINSEGLKPYNRDVLSVKLFPKQRLALAWMRQQELGTSFTLESTEEASMPKLNWAVEMRAQAQIHVRGGICADHPGFGKTITSLALIQSEFAETDAENIITELETHGSSKLHGLVTIAATLIICPLVLLDQWIAEIEDKLSYTKGVIAIRNVSDLSKWSLDDFKSARIVLVNRTVLGSEAYAERLAAFAAIPGPATTRSRSYREWVQYASAQVPSHLQVLQDDGLPRLRQHIKQEYANRMKSDEFKAVIPSRRLRGKDYVPSNSKKKTDITAQAAVSTLDTSTVGRPLLEMFYFNRIIIDEFHQYTSREYAAITTLKAEKRWGLSATPALGDFYDVAQIAGMLAVPLPIGNDARGIMKIKNVQALRKEMTDFERFDSMRSVSSNSSHYRIYQLHQRFLDTFVRRNIMDFDGMQYSDSLKTVRLDIDHQALYTELSQHLNSLDMRIKKGTKSKNTNREARITRILDDSLSAEEALSKTAAFDLDGADATTQEEGLAKLVDIRAAEVESIQQKLQQAVAVAKGKEPEPLRLWVASRLEGETIGDQDTISILERIYKDTVASKTKKPQTKTMRQKNPNSDAESGGDDAGGAAGKHALTSNVNVLAQRLLVANRSVRFARNVQLIYQAANGGGIASSRCNSSQCHSSDGAAAVSALCGHMVCRDCFEHMKDSHITKCPASGCSAHMHNYHLLWNDKMGNLLSNTHFHSGAKIDTVMDLLESIRGKDDQAIVFVQYPRQLDYVGAALEHRQIQAIVVDEPNRAGAKIEEFRKSATNGKKVTALILNASDETAAGSNLQNANHVIFLSPLLRDTQYGYESTMAQAIGRVRRHGQKKPIHVYRIVALNTIDVDILEHREKRSDALTELEAPPVKAPNVKQNDVSDGADERTQLVYEHGVFSLRPRSWLIKGSDDHDGGVDRVQGKHRVAGWEDFSSLIKFSRVYTEDDD